MNKKAEDTMFAVLIGVVIGVLMLIGIIMVGKQFLPGSEDWEGSYKELASDIKEISLENNYASTNSLLHLKENSAIIGLNPKRPEVERTGRIGDGDFHFMVNEEAYNKATDMLGQTFRNVVGEPKAFTRETHFQRPLQCADDKSCVCLCTDVSLAPTTQEYFDRTRTSQEDYERTASLRWMFLPTGFTYDQSKTITCGTLTCSELENADFYPVMYNDYYKQYFTHYDTSTWDDIAWGTRHTVDPVSRWNDVMGMFQYVKDNIAGDEYPVPDYLFENGFAFYNAKDSYTGLRTMGYSEEKLDSLPVWIEKLGNGELAVCLHSSCGQAINYELNNFLVWQQTTLQNPNSVSFEREETNVEIINPQDPTGQPLVINPLSDCELPAEPFNEYYFYEIIELLSQNSAVRESMQITPSSGVAQNGLDPRLAIKITSLESHIDVELLYTCSENEFISVRVETIYQPDSSLTYYDYCGANINRLLRVGDMIDFVGIASSDLSQYVVCVQ